VASTNKDHPTKTLSTALPPGSAKTEYRHTSDTGPRKMIKDGVQGEGNYEAARRFNESEREFVVSGKVDAAARAAAPKSEIERQEMLAAEGAAKRRAKEEDPALTKAWPESAPPAVPGTEADRKRE
jgi:hypothetical protein